MVMYNKLDIVLKENKHFRIVEKFAANNVLSRKRPTNISYRCRGNSAENVNQNQKFTTNSTKIFVKVAALNFPIG